MRKLIKRVLYLLSFLVLALLSLGWYVTNPVWGAVPPPATVPTADSAALRSHVETLASNTTRNFYNTGSLDQTAAYLRTELEAVGLKPVYQTYTVNGNTYRNVICRYGSETAPRLVVGAHYDVCEEQAGADDNASGVAGGLELARLLQQHKPTLDYCIELVLFTLEEPPAFRSEAMGSYVHAQRLVEQGVEVKGMVCLEMIGYFTDERKSQQYPAGIMKAVYPTTGNFIAVVGKTGQRKFTRTVKKAMKGACNIDVVSINAPSWIPGIDFSDHQNYWSHDWDAVMITDTSFYRNKNYHTKNDLPETLDYGRMAEVVNGVFAAIIAM